MMSEFEKLVNIVKKLRGENGCPWDREQNLYSIKNLFIEEAFELVDALDNEDIPNIREEIGDVLFHMVFHAAMAEDEGYFTLEDVLREISEKLVRRHPHVFGNTNVENTDEVLVNWDKIKLEEKKHKSKEFILDDIPNAYPSMLRAFKIQEKVRKVGFDWNNADDCMEKVNEEFNEFTDAVRSGTKEEMEHELGDIFFALINISRFLKINPDEALRKANGRFTDRFNFIEKSLKAEGRQCSEASLEEMEKLWQEAKKSE
ncbi:MAG: nucleoside triphosphate pyrophosphohydrolase [Deferribacterales bacterium]